jgi:GAF domain-containing protein
VARTVRENRGFVDNLFAKTSHASFFEKFKIDDAAPLPIQKIMSVPIRSDGCLCGVIQVSRKGEEIAKVGRDFSQHDLVILQKMSDVLAGYL